MELTKVVKFKGKRVKVKTLKQIVDTCLKAGMPFDVDESGSVRVYTDDYIGDEITLTPKEFGKEIKLKKAEIEYDEDGTIDGIKFYVGNDVVVPELTKLFSNFPKLTKEQLRNETIPRRLINKAAGECLERYDVRFFDNGTLAVGCTEFSKKEVENIFAVLTEGMSEI